MTSKDSLKLLMKNQLIFDGLDSRSKLSDRKTSNSDQQFQQSFKQSLNTSSNNNDSYQNKFQISNDLTKRPQIERKQSSTYLGNNKANKFLNDLLLQDSNISVKKRTEQSPQAKQPIQKFNLMKPQYQQLELKLINSTAFKNNNNLITPIVRQPLNGNQNIFIELLDTRSITPKYSQQNSLLNHLLQKSNPKLQNFFSSKNNQTDRRQTPSPSPPRPKQSPKDFINSLKRNGSLQNMLENEEQGNVNSSLKTIYDHIHEKIDNRLKTQNLNPPMSQKFPSNAQKQLQQKLLDEYLSSNKQKNIVNNSKKPMINNQQMRPRTDGNIMQQMQLKNLQLQMESTSSTSANGESKTDEKLSKLSKDESKEDKKEAQISSNIFKLSELKIDKIILQEENIFAMLAVIAKQNKVCKLCKNYLSLISETNIELLQVEQFLKQQFQMIPNGQILGKCIFLERIAILIILFESLGNEEEYDESQQNLKNLLIYTHNNSILVTEFLAEDLCNNEKYLGLKRQLEFRLKSIKNNKKSIKSKQNADKLALIKKNNNIIYSILQLQIENSTKDQVQELEQLLIDSDKLTLQQTAPYIIDAFQKTILNQSLNRLSQDTQQTDKTFEETSEPTGQIFEEVKEPYLQQASEDTYTLVIDLDETLVHYQELPDGGQFLLRPYAEQFISELSRYYDIVIFTAAIQDYADFILDIIDVKKVIKARLYRQHCSTYDGVTVKDISKLGRDIGKIIIIDNLPENFSLQPENGIYIQSWYGESEDRALFELAPLLKGILRKKNYNIRNCKKKGKRYSSCIEKIQGYDD